MKGLLENIVETIVQSNPLHGKKLRKNLKKVDDEFYQEADRFLGKYQILLEQEGKDINYAIECYLQMLNDINYESIQFQTTGKYSSNSFEEVNNRVYGNPLIMEYYMHGLLLSQFLWLHHYEILKYFRKEINLYKEKAINYLEVGGGHGLYISEAIRLTEGKGNYNLLDISESSINISKRMLSFEKVNFILSDIHQYHPKEKFDFITMGEVLEHVENPIELLRSLKGLLNDDGRIFITTPTNAPTIDHIYLFHNKEEIREVINSSGFEIEDEIFVCSEDVPEEMAERLKISIMYGAIIKNKK